ncbi:MAG: SDR family NAD(P)-dependent oxidoreductase [SAR202 cluster bacterium]|nr:SDR family NAD(P)-dependent oxidoreductase [SAR202 cluster bacterium]
MGERLKGKVAIVTGSGRGIGRTLALLLSQEGAAVVVNDPGVAVDGSGASSAPASEVAKEIRAAGGMAAANFDSVAEYESAGRIVQAAVSEFGRLDILCHVAGILRDRMVFNMSEEEWDSVLRVHLYGAFNMVRNAVPHMMAQRHGRIVLFSSVSGLGASGQANYASAKEGMVGFMRAASRELGPYGITVNAVYPGAATRMTATVPQSTVQRRVQQEAQNATGTGGPPASAAAAMLLGMAGVPEMRTPENNAPKVVYLCTDTAKDITGQVVQTSGWDMSYYSPRHLMAAIHKNGRWSLDELERLVPVSLAAGVKNPAPPIPPSPPSV